MAKPMFHRISPMWSPSRRAETTARALQAGGNVGVGGGIGWANERAASGPPTSSPSGRIGSGVALKADGSLLAWGGNNHGQTQLRMSPTVHRHRRGIFSYARTSARIIKVIAWGSRTTVPTAVSNRGGAAGWEPASGVARGWFGVGVGGDSFMRAIKFRCSHQHRRHRPGYGYSGGAAGPMARC